MPEPHVSEIIRNYSAAAQSVVTATALIAGGIWAYIKFGLRQERYPHIETSADIYFIGRHDTDWIVELIAYVNNKGTAQHKMSESNFEVSYMRKNDALVDAKEFGGQVLFAHQLKRGSFLPSHSRSFFVDPGVKAKYSYIARVPLEAEFVIFHWWFKYGDERDYSHAAEITVKVPSEEGNSSTIEVPSSSRAT
jgi:hypothetical protein